jgi:hypothetical protein
MLLRRECSAYTSAPLQLGVFRSEANALTAKEEYLQYYQQHPDPLAQQAYHEVNLVQDVQVQLFPTEGQFSQLAFLVLGTCEGFGQEVTLAETSFAEAYSKGQELYRRNHAGCRTNAEGEHQCVGYVDALLLDVVEIDRLRFGNRSTYFDVQLPPAKLELEVKGSLRASLTTVLRKANHVGTVPWLQALEKWNKEVAEACDCKRKCRCTEDLEALTPPIRLAWLYLSSSLRTAVGYLVGELSHRPLQLRSIEPLPGRPADLKPTRGTTSGLSLRTGAVVSLLNNSPCRPRQSAMT